MQTGKHLNKAAVLIYFGFLLLIVGSSLLNGIGLCDIAYLLVVLCCVFKYFMILKVNK